MPHWGRRFVFFLIGIVLFYAPFALLTKLLLWLSGKPHLGDAHSICLRMPIQWLAQPWMYGTIFENPVYHFAVLVLPLMALFLGPLFCGWMCPAGLFTEFISRFVPPRFQMNLSNKKIAGCRVLEALSRAGNYLERTYLVLKYEDRPTDNLKINQR